MKILQSLFAVTLVLIASCARQAPEQSDDQQAAAAEKPKYGTWVSIFNGSNLDGWTPKFAGHELGENYKNTFRVQDGKLVVSYDEYDTFNGEFGHIFYNEKLSHYRLRLEYRFVGEQVANGPEWAIRNNGIMLHCQDPATMRVDQSFPVSIEDQLLGGLGEGERSTGNMCSPGSNVMIDGELVTQHCVLSNSPTYNGDQWVKAEVEVRGSDVIRHIINGEEVFTITNPQFDANDPDGQQFITADDKMMREGYVALQAESHPTEFRNIELMLLDPNEAN